MTLLRTTAFILTVFLLNIYETKAQDSTHWIFSPALIGGIFPQFDYNLKEYNPLLIPYLPISKGDFYGEVRYNYDRNATLGLYGGKSFVRGMKATHILTPQLGALIGDYKGLSLQFYYNLIHPKVEFNLTNNYAFVFNERPDFYFNWTDIQFPVFKRFRAGATVQIFADEIIQTCDPGVLIGYKTEKLYLMLSSFNSWNADKHYLFFAVQYILKTKKQ